MTATQLRGSADLRPRFGRAGLLYASVCFVFILILPTFVLYNGALRAEISTGLKDLNEEGGDYNIPFLPALLQLPEMAVYGEIRSLNESTLREVSYIPYNTAKKLCMSPHFQRVPPGEDRLMYEISVGSAGSTWQLTTIAALAQIHGFSIPTVSVSKEDVMGWKGLEHYEYETRGVDAWGRGKTFARLFKLQFTLPELREKAALKFTAFRLDSPRNSSLDEFFEGVCPCCTVHKNLLGDVETETALIYMHAFAMGFDVSEADILKVREKLALWMKEHYCFPGSVHTSACKVLDEFPHLKGFNVPEWAYDEAFAEDEG
eukprot:CAMPEP_0198735970 /NCGR_PEP_ID=MMETSP1475-20131203/62816_1 /TAXON_ID= ORGANISM="Unidentified sp., Strain CCMP1999" /NCGR_SAMPLE_ID=MMETSP1475 /ASSEMBLY_ACC=CAM_ASM_001111 /LENGTH=316 /DNA_ID=CAMNT_0044499711 /DNA_START=57 /DNA_END=1007 /DNA_ORIENTATION=-